MEQKTKASEGGEVKVKTEGMMASLRRGGEVIWGGGI